MKKNKIFTKLPGPNATEEEIKEGEILFVKNAMDLFGDNFTEEEIRRILEEEDDGEE